MRTDALLGPLMIDHLGEGGGGVRKFVEHFGPALRAWREDLRTWRELPPGAMENLEGGR